MNRNDLFQGIGEIDEEILEQSEKNKRQQKHRVSRWMGAAAAVLAIVVGMGALLGPNLRKEQNKQPTITENTDSDVKIDTSLLKAYKIEEVTYPKMAACPQINDYTDATTGEFDDEGYFKAYTAWKDSIEKQRQETGYADGLETFFAESIREFLPGKEGENIAYSPLNVYMALGMLAEVTDGNSRKQILDLMNTNSVEALRTQANAVWNAHYRDDGITKSILASSLWLNQDITFVPETMKVLADYYYASSYYGKMGSDEFNTAFQTWLNEQTGGMLKNQINGLKLDKETILALATTIYYQVEWEQNFRKEFNKKDTFHAVAKDIPCEFMSSSGRNDYYWGEGFSAVGKKLGGEDESATMWMILPDEGVEAENLLKGKELTEFILNSRKWENKKEVLVNLLLPKFDISSQIDLQNGLKSLGITDVFDEKVSDFSAMTTDEDEIFLSKAQHGVRVAVDEKGVSAAAYTVMMMNAGMPKPPEEEIDFVLNRPFLFAITSPDGLPLFVGIVNQPN